MQGCSGSQILTNTLGWPGMVGAELVSDCQAQIVERVRSSTTRTEDGVDLYAREHEWKRASHAARSDDRCFARRRLRPRILSGALPGCMQGTLARQASRMPLGSVSRSGPEAFLSHVHSDLQARDGLLNGEGRRLLRPPAHLNGRSGCSGPAP